MLMPILSNEMLISNFYITKDILIYIVDTSFKLLKI